MIVGSGFKVDSAKNGCVLLYTADEPAGPWEYKGIIASGDCKLGRVWECPALAQVMFSSHSWFDNILHYMFASCAHASSTNLHDSSCSNQLLEFSGGLLTVQQRFGASTLIRKLMCCV